MALPVKYLNCCRHSPISLKSMPDTTLAYLSEKGLSDHGSIFSWLFHVPNCLPFRRNAEEARRDLAGDMIPAVGMLIFAGYLLL